ncbi:Metalloprotease MmpA [Acaryochloris thomasi RCC1774]|uniref:Zinc metalloprotease n=1 Tax=Acaryochloris thomasi RCC1774 TaxID=1764569 RepID=A0A2W1JLG4_9CYAN|nr:RIP metalloprotease RseP [Acaryochloris thomasi]PZD74193.1 Metalloprotease MmpA [Acaryochloris thomasi RCC1774]
MPGTAAIFAMIAVIGLLVAVHELGHFLAARLQGIHVNRFSIGFGPALWRYQGPETEYALRSIPLGGYVGFPDDDPDSTLDPSDPNLLKNRPLLDRAIVISAGVIANLVFAYIVLVAQLGGMGVIDYQPGVLISQVAADVSSVAADAGIQAGDVVVSINNQSLGARSEATTTLMETIKSSPNQTLKLGIQRGEQSLDLNLTPKISDTGKVQIGVQLFPNVRQLADGRVARRAPHNPGEILGAAADEYQKIITYMAGTFGQLIGNFSEAAGQVAGPVGIVAMGAEMASTDVSRLFDFAAVISINLAFINILPLPALDGGQLAFLLIEGLLGKPLPSRLQEGVMQTGLVLLLSLGVVLIVRDTANLNWVQQLFQ